MLPVLLHAALAALQLNTATPDSVLARVATVAGPLTLVAADGGATHVVRLPGAVRLYAAESYGVPDAGLRIAGVFRGLAPREDVVVLSQSDGGTECRAEYVLIAVRASGRHVVSAPIGNCAAPALRREGSSLRIRFPQSGDADAEEWVYSAGRVRRGA